MNHSPMAAPENGARYWLAGLSAAVAETMMVYSSAPAASRAEMVRTTFDCLLADRDVDRVNRAEVLVAGSEADLVDAALIDDGVDADGGLAGAAITDDELALAAADRDHGINGHDAGEEWLVDGLADHDAGGDFLDRVGFLGIDRALAVDGAAEGVNHAAEEGAADGDGEELAGGGDLVAFLQLGDVAEDDAADLVFLKVERDADGAAGELHHLVIHDVREAIEFGHAVGDGADGAGVLLDGLAGKLGDLLFDLVDDVAHGAVGSVRGWL
jgi:hypothetical protein